MFRAFLILLGVVMCYIALFVGALWGNQITTEITAFFPETVILVATKAFEIIVLLTPALLAGALAGFALALYRGGETKPLAITCGIIAIALFIYSVVMEPLLATSALTIAATLIGVRYSRRLSQGHWFNQLIGQISLDEQEKLDAMKRHIEYLTSSKAEADAELAELKSKRSCSTLEAELEEHEIIFLAGQAVFEADRNAYDQELAHYNSSGENVPAYLNDWESHIASSQISLRGANDNLKSARHVVKVALSLLERRKYSTALTTSNMARSELEFMVGNLEFVTPFKIDNGAT